MTTLCKHKLREEYLVIMDKFQKLTEEATLLRTLMYNVEYTPEQQDSMLKVSRRKVDAITMLDQEMFALEQMLEVLRTNEVMESSSPTH